MKRDEAIATLEAIRQFGIGHWILDKEENEAFEMAIEALSEPTCKKCTDLISREEASKAIEAETTEAWTESDADFNRGMDMAKSIVESLPSAEPKWIPASERLPEFDTKVLAWVENKDPKNRFNKPGIYIAELKDKEVEHDPDGDRNFWGIPGYDSVWTVWAWSYFAEPDVKAWMPLPEPYKGGE